VIDYTRNITNSGLSIYDEINPDNAELFIPLYALERILTNALVGVSLSGLPLRTRSKVVKAQICEALGYPIPRSFKKTQPRFPGQNFDVYAQKSMNVQIWNEEVDVSRRYVFLRLDEADIITAVRVITGGELVRYDRTGRLTTKYQATMHAYSESKLFSSHDTEIIENWISHEPCSLRNVNPNSYPRRNQLLPIGELYRRLLPMVGKAISYIDAVQERNRGAELHEMICKHLGYSVYEDDGSYPDIANQLLEVKLQTSPTIDLGLHSPEDGELIVTVGDTSFYSEDVRYVIFDGKVSGAHIILRNLYLISGADFNEQFPIWEGKNAKIQLPLPSTFFD